MPQIEGGYTIYPNHFMSQWKEEFNADQFRAVVHLWMRANHNGCRIVNHRDKVIQIQRGQVYDAVRNIAQAVGIGKNAVHALLKGNKFRTYASMKVRQGRTLITFHNYKSYTNPMNYKSTKSGTNPGQNAVQTWDLKKASLTEKPEEAASPHSKGGAASGSAKLNENIKRIIGKIRSGNTLTENEEKLYLSYVDTRRLCPKSDRQVVPEMEKILDEKGHKSFEELRKEEYGGEK